MQKGKVKEGKAPPACLSPRNKDAYHSFVRHCPHAKHHEDRNPKYHEEQQKDVTEILAAHRPKNVERELK
jgi:hypothetical protein